MKNIVVLLAVLISFSFGQSIYKKVDDSTNSGVTEGSAIPDEQRPAGFIIKHVKDDVVFNQDGKVLDENGDVKLIRLNVKFDFDKYDIKDEYAGQIDEAVAFVKKHKNLSITVEGHTDSKGTNEYNYILSELRAKKVALAISQQGIDESKITTKGFGETVPVASNETEEGRALNRRVDISFNK
jgi:OOP family OmpA-OmpF porin